MCQMKINQSKTEPFLLYLLPMHFLLVFSDRIIKIRSRGLDQKILPLKEVI